MTESWRRRLFRDIPKVDDFLERSAVRQALEAHPRWVVLETVREVLEHRRDVISKLSTEASKEAVSSDGELERAFADLISLRALPRLRPVINATGIIIHTNLGRAPLPREALEQALSVGRGYSNLEYALDEGRRGSRQDHLTELIQRLTGAESALAVNSNAAAVMLCLGTLARDREVIVSRGELVEIGGSFRIPDVMQKSGAILREVGTTNKTHLDDYRRAIGPETSLLMKVHTSNFQVVGFTAAVDVPDLVTLGRQSGLPVMEDLGSGCLVDLSPYGLHGEPTVQSSVQAGADVVTFSGDKLLGGPQAGIIVGSSLLLDEIRRNPVHRAVRLDKFTIAALEATLRLYLEGERVFEKIPVLRMIAEPAAMVRRRAARLLRRLKAEAREELDAQVVPCSSQVGGGSLPLGEIRSAALSLGGTRRPSHLLEPFFRRLQRPIIGRLYEGRLLFDMRTVDNSEIPEIADAIEAARRA